MTNKLITEPNFNFAEFQQEAIAQVFPKTEIQLCVVYQIRNSLKYGVSKDQKAFMQEFLLDNTTKHAKLLYSKRHYI